MQVITEIARLYLFAAGAVALVAVFIARGNSEIDRMVYGSFLGIGIALVGAGFAI